MLCEDALSLLLSRNWFEDRDHSYPTEAYNLSPTLLNTSLNVWLAGWMVGWMDGWLDEEMEGQMSSQTVG